MGLRLVAVAVVMALSTLVLSAQRNRTDDVLAREAAYLREFVQRFSDVVAEERYVQDAKTVPRARTRGTVVRSRLFTRHVELMSDFLLVKLKESGEWQAFRDVFDVNGEPVRDRDERLTKLFLNPTRSVLDDANAIALEGARLQSRQRRAHDQQPLAGARVSPGRLSAALPVFPEYQRQGRRAGHLGPRVPRNSRVRR